MAVLYAIFWLNLPFILLIVGLGRLRATAPAAWRWPAIWTGAVTAGIALDPFGLWALSTPSAGAGFQWTWLTATIGYLVLGAAMTAILLVAPQSAATTRPAIGASAP
jgi:hypothetical protein